MKRQETTNKAAGEGKTGTPANKGDCHLGRQKIKTVMKEIRQWLQRFKHSRGSKMCICATTTMKHDDWSCLGSYVNNIKSEQMTNRPILMFVQPESLSASQCDLEYWFIAAGSEINTRHSLYVGFFSFYAHHHAVLFTTRGRAWAIQLQPVCLYFTVTLFLSLQLT